MYKKSHGASLSAQLAVPKFKLGKADERRRGDMLKRSNTRGLIQSERVVSKWVHITNKCASVNDRA
jgi:hypothetical protein